MTNPKMSFIFTLAMQLLASSTTMATNSGDVALKVDRELQGTGINLAGIVDTTNFDWADTIFRVTVDLLNDKGNGFFDDELFFLGPISYELFDSGCDGYKALSAYWDVRDRADAVIGARCSGASTPLAWIGGLDNIPQISMSSTSVKLSDKTEFPNFSRVVSPDDENGQVGALVETMKLFGWDRVTIINTDTPYAKDLATSFQGIWQGEIAYLATVKLEMDGSVDESSLRKVLEGAPLDDPINNSKVVLLLAHDQHAYPILETAMNFFPDETFWVGPQAWAGRSPTSTNWMPRVPGYLGVVPFRNRDSVYQQFLELGGNRLSPILDSDGNLPDYAAEYTVDSIVAMAIALAYTPFNERNNGQRVAEELRRNDFRGVTGHVRFTINGDRRDPEFTILNYQKISGRYTWVDVGTARIGGGFSEFGPDGIQGVCFAGVGCGLDSAPNDSPPVPPDRTATWVSVAIVLLCSVFLLTFWLYRRKKIQASRKTKAILAAKEAELNDFRNSVVDMCTAEQQYVPKLDGGSSNGIHQPPTRVRWCWKETTSQMGKWSDEMIQGKRSNCWIKYDDSASEILELAYQEQGHVGQCVPMAGYTVDFGKMVQTKDETKYEREVKRLRPSSKRRALDLSNKTQAGQERPDEIAKEPQMILVPGDIIQISKKRKDGWSYGSKLHMEDEPLGRRLVQLLISRQDKRRSSGRISVNGQGHGEEDDGKMIITDNHGWFPSDVTRVPNTDDLAILKKTLGGADNLAAPENWDKIVDPSVVQKSAPLDKRSKEYRKVVDSFLSTLPPKTKIVSVQRIQNMAMWQSYVVKRKTVIDRDQFLEETSGMKLALARFERSWLWHGTNADSIEKIIQQGFNRSFCGKNATMYGKGVYFARDASYSSCNTYSPPDDSGLKYILACSVVVGEFCRGKKDARTPDLRDATKNVLYDSTVDSLTDPRLYVTYHDAQAYPEYLIAFKETRKASM